jgi:dienelactone hydrolase
MPGLHPLVVRFADRVAAAGMTVYLPSLFGAPGKTVSAGYAIGEMLRAICIRREFHVWSGQGSSPIVDWLRALARKALADCGGRGVGAVGMCFTGGFALAMMTEPAVVAPVLSQPSLPLNGKGAGIDASPAEIACVKQRLEEEDLTVMGLRFRGDRLVPDARFAALRTAFGERFEAIELDSKDAQPGGGMAPHSVLTIHLRDEPGSATKKAEERVIAFFKQRTAAA